MEQPNFSITPEEATAILEAIDQLRQEKSGYFDDHGFGDYDQSDDLENMAVGWRALGRIAVKLNGEYVAEQIETLALEIDEAADECLCECGRMVKDCATRDDQDAQHGDR